MTNMRSRLAGLLMAGGLFAASLAVAGAALAANTQVVAGRQIAGHGTLLVAAANQMTLYTFAKDVANSGTSNCTGGCLAAWPALTIAAGDTPTGDATVTGTLGTITRADNGQTQVTYNGLPLYFFHNDAAPGDTNGIYPNWQAVTLAAAPTTQVVAGRQIAGHGTLLVASANQMTVYTFAKDVANSGTSNCTGGCLDAWPALTIAAGQTPTGDATVTGKLGTITRADNGQMQVTYNGLPLYFFHNDKAPGDTNGIYPNWQAVVLVAPVASPTPAGSVAGATGSPRVTLPPTSTVPAQDSNRDTSSALAWAVLLVVGSLGLVGSLRFATRRNR